MLKPKRTIFEKIFAAFAATAVGFVVLAYPPAPAAAATADEQVRRLNEVLLEAMKNADQLGYRGRFDLLAPVLRDVFNFGGMAKFAVGQSWDGFDEAVKQALVDAFTRLSIAEYANRFDGFSGERFEVGNVVEGRRGLVLVLNSIFDSDGDEIEINYVLHRPDGDWRIIDIRLGGVVSELSTKRSEYTSVLRSIGPSGLIRLLEEKIVKFGGN